MQFRVQKNRLSLLAYRGYSKEKKRSIIKTVGTIDWKTLKVPEQLLEELKEDEKIQLEKYLDAERQKRRTELIRNTTQAVPRNLKNMNAALAAFPTERPAACDKNWAEQTWLALRELEDHLRRFGFHKPHRPKT